MEFKTKAALTEWVNDQTMAEIAAYYNALPGVKPVKKFESREVAVKRIWAALSPDKPRVARKPKAARKKATSGRKQPMPKKASEAAELLYAGAYLAAAVLQASSVSPFGRALGGQGYRLRRRGDHGGWQVLSVSTMTR